MQNIKRFECRHLSPVQKQPIYSGCYTLPHGCNEALKRRSGYVRSALWRHGIKIRADNTEYVWYFWLFGEILFPIFVFEFIDVFRVYHVAVRPRRPHLGIWNDSWVVVIACYGGRMLLLLHARVRPRQNGRHFADAIFKCIFLNENVSISIKISLKYVPKGPINNIPALVQIMAWRRTGDKPLSEPMWLIYRRIYAPLDLNELNEHRLLRWAHLSSGESGGGGRVNHYVLQY